MSKALRVISIAMPFVLLALFFIPNFAMGIVEGSGVHFVSANGEPVYFYTTSVYDAAHDGIGAAKTCTIIFFVLSMALSVFCAFFAQRHYLVASLNLLPCSFIWIWASIFIKSYNRPLSIYCIPHAAFYISLILSVFFLAVFVAYAVKWRLDRRPPREHKPTKEERIAELERQVAELTKEKDAE